MTAHTRITRRTALKRTLAAFGAPLVVRASALGANGSTAPSERINLGYVGLGLRLRRLLPVLLGAPDAHVAAVCDVQEQKRLDTKQTVDRHYSAEATYRGTAAYNDYREILAREDIDAVVIATPEHWHAVQVIDAAKAGKDIYCEKPMSLTIREGRAMVEAVRRYGRVFQTGSQQRSSSEFRFACEMARSGRIGQITRIHCNAGGPSSECHLPGQPVTPGVDWDLWLGPAPWRPFNAEYITPSGWRGCRAFSGGGICDWGAHAFDIAQWALDADSTGPVEIIPPDDRAIDRRPGKSAPAASAGRNDQNLLRFRYANGIEVYHCGIREQMPAGRPYQVVIHGTEGKIAVARGGLQTWPAKLMSAAPTAHDEVHLSHPPGHLEDWLRCIRSRGRPICDVEVGCRSVSVCLLGGIAWKLRRRLKWDPAGEQFIGDPIANRYLDRPRRAPWTL